MYTRLEREAKHECKLYIGDVAMLCLCGRGEKQGHNIVSFKHRQLVPVNASNANSCNISHRSMTAT